MRDCACETGDCVLCGAEFYSGLTPPGRCASFASCWSRKPAARARHCGTKRHPYTAETLTDVELCGIRSRRMLRVLERNPDSALRVIGGFHRGLQQVQALIRVLGLKSAAERVASFLLSLGHAREPRKNLLTVRPDAPANRRAARADGRDRERATSRAWHARG